MKVKIELEISEDELKFFFKALEEFENDRKHTR
jgi:hypothetical protein